MKKRVLSLLLTVAVLVGLLSGCGTVKEKAENDPIVSLYNRRCAAIRTECGRGTITKDFAEAAKQLAKEHKQEAMHNDKYAKEEYRKAMSREALYAEVDRKIK